MKSVKPVSAWLSPRRLGHGLLAGLLIYSSVGCAGPEGLPAKIPSSAPISRPIRVQSHQTGVSASPAFPFLAQVTAVAVSAREIPPSGDLARWLQSLAEQGVTMVICEMGTGSEPLADLSANGHQGAGIYFRSEWAPTVRDVIGELVPSAHRQGLAVFVGLSPRRIDWVSSTFGWNDRRYDPADKQLRPSPALDLFHPAFQEYLVGLLADLAATGIDGLLFQNDAPLGPFDGFSAFALQGFEKEFHVPLDPLQLFRDLSTEQVLGPSHVKTAQYPAEFWRWIGWRARERMKIMERLGRAMRLHAPTLHLAVEVHPDAVTDPRAALIRYAEDVLEAKRWFRYIVLRADVTANDSKAPGSADMLEQMTALLGRDREIWVTVPHHITGKPLGSSRIDRANRRADVGLIYTYK